MAAAGRLTPVGDIPRDIWAVVPVKELAGAKQRLAGVLTPAQRQHLAAIMVEDVLEALAAVAELGGIAVVTIDPAAARLALRYGARVIEQGAREGHTGAVMAAARVLAREGRAGMLTMPGDIPLVAPDDVAAILAAHRAAPSFSIVPAHDDLGSNAIAMSPADAVPLRFGEDSFFPHLEAARRHGIEPTITRLPRIGCDIDHADDLARFMAMAGNSPCRTLAYLRAEAASRVSQGTPGY